MCIYGIIDDCIDSAKVKKNNLIKIQAKIAYDNKTDRFAKFLMAHPLSVCYKITKKCNHNCPHCIASSGPDAKYGLSTMKAKQVFKKIKDSGIVRVDITGGEPYIRSDIDELLEYAISLGLQVVITTNGSLLKAQNFETLSRLKILVQTSIDGPQELNDRLRFPGSFEASVKAIRKLKKLKVPVRINCLIQKRNKNIVREMIALAKKLGVDNLYFILTSAQGRAYGNKERFCLSKSEEKIVHKEILKYRKRSDVKVKMLDFKKYARACTLIENNGDLISQSWDEGDCVNAGNIFKKDLNDIWINSGAFDHALHLIQYIRHPVLYG